MKLVNIRLLEENGCFVWSYFTRSRFYLKILHDDS